MSESQIVRAIRTVATSVYLVLSFLIFSTIAFGQGVSGLSYVYELKNTFKNTNEFYNTTLIVTGILSFVLNILRQYKQPKVELWILILFIAVSLVFTIYGLLA